MKDSNFYMTINSEGMMITDFWVSLCGPCRMVARIIKELAKNYSGRVNFVKLNVDENPMIAQQLAVMSIPTIIVSKIGTILVGSHAQGSFKEEGRGLPQR